METTVTEPLAADLLSSACGCFSSAPDSWSHLLSSDGNGRFLPILLAYSPWKHFDVRVWTWDMGCGVGAVGLLVFGAVKPKMSFQSYFELYSRNYERLKPINEVPSRAAKQWLGHAAAEFERATLPCLRGGAMKRILTQCPSLAFSRAVPKMLVACSAWKSCCCYSMRSAGRAT